MEGRRGEGVSEVSEEQRKVEEVQEYSMQLHNLACLYAWNYFV